MCSTGYRRHRCGCTGPTLELTTAGRCQRAHAGRSPGPPRLDGDLEQHRGLPRTGRQCRAGHHQYRDLKKAKREQKGELDGTQKKQQKETNSKRKEIREKLQKFLAKIPVFMYVTDFREEAQACHRVPWTLTCSSGSPA